MKCPASAEVANTDKRELNRHGGLLPTNFEPSAVEFATTIGAGSAMDGSFITDPLAGGMSYRGW